MRKMMRMAGWAGAMLSTMGCPASAADFDLTYTTEMQLSLTSGEANWVNLLRLDFSQELCHGFRFGLATVSIAKTRGERLMDDLQTFSNIEEDNLPLALSVMGMEWHKGQSDWFFGIRNLNEDYFTSPVTSLFTNSSCGIFPTLSANFPLANYPVASVGIHYRLTTEHLGVQASLYNGTGYSGFAGRENVFRVCPASDGLLGITSVNYRKNDNGYYLGCALHSGVRGSDENGVEENVAAEAAKMRTVLWAYAEQQVGRGLSVLAQGSLVPGASSGCRSYAGLGFVMKCGATEGGLFADYADFSGMHEWAGELTWKIPCRESLTVQPALHFVSNSTGCDAVALLRLSCTF